MSLQRDVVDFFGLEMQSQEYIRTNIKDYRYVGEEGREYEVVQSIFAEINRLPEVANQHIRWYAVIVYLVDSFYRLRIKYPVLDSASPLVVPPYIEDVEAYVREIAGLGVLAAAKEDVDPGYLARKLGRIQGVLTKLLNEMDGQNLYEAREAVYLLTVENATENVTKLQKLLWKPRTKMLFREVRSEMFERLISQRLDSQSLAVFHNMDAFWNGFVPWMLNPYQ